jgi:hypothetical protein
MFKVFFRMKLLTRGGLALLLAAALAACGIANAAVPRVLTAAAHPGAATPIVVTPGPLSVSITSPANDAVVNTPQVTVTGKAPPDTVITVNDAIVVVDATGQFSATVDLDTGPNELAIKASDAAGDETDSQLIVTYEPAG